MRRFLHDALKACDPAIDAFGDGYLSFTLQNSAEILGRRFAAVTLAEYPDALRVTSAADLAGYLRSSIGITEADPARLDGIEAYFQRVIDAEGVVVIPKEVGVFTARRAV